MKQHDDGLYGLSAIERDAGAELLAAFSAMKRLRVAVARIDFADLDSETADETVGELEGLKPLINAVRDRIIACISALSRCETYPRPSGEAHDTRPSLS